MKRKLYFFLMLFLITIIPRNVKATCSDSETIRLSKLAQNVKFAYVYNEKNKTFTITVTNLKKDLKIEYVNENKKYNTEKEVNIYNSNSGKHTFMIYANTNCSKEYILTKNIELPYYNELYKSKICSDIKNFKYCQKWNKVAIDASFAYEKINEYKENNLKKEVKKEEIKKTDFEKIIDNIKKIYVDNYYIILPITISILCLIIYVKNKKESLV